MKLRSLIVVSCAVLGVAANASIDMDHINVVGGSVSDLFPAAAMQIANDYPFSSMVIDDFNASGNIVTSVSVALDVSASYGFDFNQVRGWQISFFDSVANAANSGFSLNQNTVAQTFTAASAIIPIGGTNAEAPAYVVTFNNLNLDLGATGHFWVGVSAEAQFNTAGQVFILQNTDPAVLGAGTADDAVFVDPTSSFGGATSTQEQSNAAYQVVTDCVPEPATLALVGAGLLGFLKRRHA